MEIEEPDNIASADHLFDNYIVIITHSAGSDNYPFTIICFSKSFNSLLIATPDSAAVVFLLFWFCFSLLLLFFVLIIKTLVDLHTFFFSKKKCFEWLPIWLMISKTLWLVLFRIRYEVPTEKCWKIIFFPVVDLIRVLDVMTASKHW